MTTELMLRTCDSDLRSWDSFKWPESGPVEAPDWDPAPRCGGGLHGLLWGKGNGGELLDWRVPAKWLVCEINSEDIVHIPGGKIKVPRATVVHCGDQLSATNYLIAHGGKGRIDGASVAAGHNTTIETGEHGSATVGHHSTAFAGNYGTAVAGEEGIATTRNLGTSKVGKHGTASSLNYGTSIAGEYGEAIARECGVAVAGDRGLAETGFKGKSLSGYGGTSIVGFGGTAVSGDEGTSIADDSGVAISGYHGKSSSGRYGKSDSGTYGTSRTGSRGRASAGLQGTASAGEGGEIQILWVDVETTQTLVGHIGEDGLLPDTKYKVGVGGKFCKVEGETDDNWDWAEFSQESRRRER